MSVCCAGIPCPLTDPTSEAEARRLFEKAIELDPGYAKAYALLAFFFCRAWSLDMSGSDTALDEAFALATKAVELDDGQETCVAALGYVNLCRRSYDLAEHYYARALALNPNSPTVLANLGDIYVRLGDPEKGMAYLKEAKVIDPFFDPTWYWPCVGIAHFVTRQYPEAISALSVNRSRHTKAWVQAYVAACYGLTDEIDRAKYHAAEVLRLMPEFSIARFVSKESFRLSSDSDHLIQGLHKAGLPE
jgi:adenylate cyclase